MHDQPTPAHEPVEAIQSASPDAYKPEERDEWFDEEPETLPRRPRRRLLTPLPVALLCLLLTACGFIGGVLVEKGQGASGSGAPGGSALSSRFAALRSAAAGGSAGSAASSGASTAGGSGAAPSTGFPSGATVGEVAFVHGSTLYVTNTAGNTVEVKTSAASKVTKTVGGTVHAIRPGEQVLISGTTAANGTVSAASIRVEAGAASGLGGLLGAGGGSSGAAGTGTGSSSGPALFGSG